VECSLHAKVHPSLSALLTVSLLLRETNLELDKVVRLQEEESKDIRVTLVPIRYVGLGLVVELVVAWWVSGRVGPDWSSACCNS